jgi:hypothetical protein
VDDLKEYMPRTISDRRKYMKVLVGQTWVGFPNGERTLMEILRVDEKAATVRVRWQDGLIDDRLRLFEFGGRMVLLTTGCDCSSSVAGWSY